MRGTSAVRLSVWPEREEAARRRDQVGAAPEIHLALAVGRTLERVYAELLATGATSGERLRFADYNKIVGLDEARDFDAAAEGRQ